MFGAVPLKVRYHLTQTVPPLVRSVALTETGMLDIGWYR